VGITSRGVYGLVIEKEKRPGRSRGRAWHKSQRYIWVAWLFARLTILSRRISRQKGRGNGEAVKVSVYVRFVKQALAFFFWAETASRQFPRFLRSI